MATYPPIAESAILRVQIVTSDQRHLNIRTHTGTATTIEVTLEMQGLTLDDFEDMDPYFGGGGYNIRFTSSDQINENLGVDVTIVDQIFEQLFTMFIEEVIPGCPLVVADWNQLRFDQSPRYNSDDVGALVHALGVLWSNPEHLERCLYSAEVRAVIPILGTFLDRQPRATTIVVTED